MKTLKITYYALLREQRGEGSEELQTDAQTAEELYNHLKSQYGFTLSTDILRIAINNEFANWQTILNDGDEIVFIPPVAGG